ncbi:hypothetical protein LTS03_003644 [Exophiala xenobiotica]|nr:hypothetical protein LTR61_004126 [Exophiala xenobiotica]KAK5371378.1 hypothetical protein LTR11_006405 [Exophiala xenobiotica]KAK5380805.1 hypothetical protein LTS03_003644 [Exophiala xenobiotica]
MAHEFDYFTDVLRATQLIAFMGTPHRGSQIAAALGPLATFANFWLDISLASIFTGSMRTDLIHMLSRDSVKLDEINQSFKRRAKGMTIISCYERVKPPGSSSLVVEKQSALPGLPEEIEISIQADHMAMCRFSSRNDPGYEPLTRAIIQAVKQMMPDTSHRSFTESESKYIATFGRRPDVPIDEPLQGTCTWSIATREYSDWRAEQLRDSMAQSRTKDELVCSFFCARDIESRKDARSPLRAIILQILSARKDVIRQIKAASSSIRYEYESSFETLWHIFEMAVEITSCSCLYIVIDALDECEEKSRAMFLAKFLHMVRPRNLDGEIRRNKIKLIISGQPLVTRSWRFGDGSLSQFYIDMEGRPEGLVRDLQRFIDHKVEDLVYNTICSETSGEQLKRKLYALAENSFLWLSVVLEDLRHGLNYRDGDVQRVLTTIPGSLKDSYTKHLPPMSESQLPRLRCYLQLLAACARPLTLSEVDVFTTLHDRQSTECISPVDGAFVLNSLRRALGSLVKFPDGKVQLIHSTVKGYFLALESKPKHPLHKTHGVDLDTAHLLVAKACMQNLLQEADSPDDLDEERLSSEMPSSSSISDHSSEGEADQFFADVLDIEDVIFLRDENIISKDVLSHLRSRYPGYDYATCYWDHHYAHAEYLADAFAQKDAIKLLSCGSPRVTRWYSYKANHSPTAFPDHSEISALVLAALFGYPITLRRLLSNCGPTNDNTKLQSALYWASSRGHLESINVLLEHKTPLIDTGRNRSALAVAIQGGFTEACEVLLGADDSDPNYSGLRAPPPLVLAAAHNHVEILIRLLRHGSIDMNQTSVSGHTALMQACRSGSGQCLKELLRDGRSNINACDSDGRTALIHACMASHAMAVQQLLGEPLLNVHLCDKYGRNAMSYAAEKATLPIVRRLFHAQVSIAQKDAHGRNAISWAAKVPERRRTKIIMDNVYWSTLSRNARTA